MGDTRIVGLSHLTGIQLIEDSGATVALEQMGAIKPGSVIAIDDLYATGKLQEYLQHPVYSELFAGLSNQQVLVVAADFNAYKSVDDTVTEIAAISRKPTDLIQIGGVVGMFAAGFWVAYQLQTLLQGSGPSDTMSRRQMLKLTGAVAAGILAAGAGGVEIYKHNQRANQRINQTILDTCDPIVTPGLKKIKLNRSPAARTAIVSKKTENVLKELPKMKFVIPGGESVAIFGSRHKFPNELSQADQDYTDPRQAMADVLHEDSAYLKQLVSQGKLPIDQARILLQNEALNMVCTRVFGEAANGQWAEVLFDPARKLNAAFLYFDPDMLGFETKDFNKVDKYTAELVDTYLPNNK